MAFSDLIGEKVWSTTAARSKWTGPLIFLVGNLLTLASRARQPYDDGIHRLTSQGAPKLSAAKQRIRVGHSPDPDDAFMFHALANGKIDTGPYEFEHELVDIETLNRRAFSGELELTAVSLHAYAYLTDKYVLCPCGASMGDHYGPMVVARAKATIDDLQGSTIAVPGTLTTAFLALRLCLGSDFKHVVVPFDEIIDAVEPGEYQGQPVDAGLIIHEGQLTYADRGLALVVDTGPMVARANRSAACRWAPMRFARDLGEPTMIATSIAC